jgi:hypothetical protein
MTQTLASSQSTEFVELPTEVAGLLKAEAKRSRKSVAQIVLQWLEDQSDGREAAKRMQDLKSGKTKAIPADEVYARLGI